MKFPADSPDWIEEAFRQIEDRVGRGIEDAKTSDDAMKASGAYGLWRQICAEFEMEAGKQEEALKGMKRFVNAR